jgi:hypothetical protein
MDNKSFVYSGIQYLVPYFSVDESYIPPINAF